MPRSAVLCSEEECRSGHFEINMARSERQGIRSATPYDEMSLGSGLSRSAITTFRRGADGAFAYQKCVASTLATPGVPLMTFTCSTI